MAVYEDREAFIPYRRTELIELCIADGQLADSDAQKFRDFCEILSAYYHFEFHRSFEMLKDNFAPFNPDSDTKDRIVPNSEQQADMEAKLISAFQAVLARANYIPLSEEMLEEVCQKNSLIELKTQIDFDDFEQMVCYYQGEVEQKTTVKKFGRDVEQTIDVFERVVLLLKFKSAEHFLAKKIPLEKLKFTPGKMYLYYYKHIPKYDLEFLFPNIKISMTLKDRLLLVVPAIGAAIPVTLKLLPQLLLIIGLIWYLFFGQSIMGNFNRDQLTNIMPVLVAALSLIVALGGFGFKQYTNYNYKKIRFQKNITDTLFFRNLANNASVFAALIDAAEEEECKEIILVYYHLLTSKIPLTSEQLDNQIEAWLENKFGTKIDFDINGPLRNLQAIQGKVLPHKEDEESSQNIPLLSYGNQGFCQVPSLEDAKKIVDYVWDNAFLYSH